MLIAILMLAAGPSAEAERLGHEIAGKGTLAALLPMMKLQQISELMLAHPELSAAEQTKLREIAEREFTAGQARIFAAEGQGYATALSLPDLRAIAAYQRSPAARRMRAAMPKVIGGTMRAMQGLDFKDDVAKAMCAETKKLCG